MTFTSNIKVYFIIFLFQIMSAMAVRRRIQVQMSDNNYGLGQQYAMDPTLSALVVGSLLSEHPALAAGLIGMYQGPNTRAQNGLNDPQTVLYVPQTGLHVPQNGFHVSPTGLHVPQNGLQVSQAGLHVPQSGLHVSQTGLHVPQTGLQTRLHVPQSGLLVPQTSNLIGQTYSPAYAFKAVSTPKFVIPNRNSFIADTPASNYDVDQKPRR